MSDGDRRILDRGREPERAGDADKEAAEEQERQFRMRAMARRWIQRKASLGARRQTVELPKASMPLPSDVRARMEPQLGADLSSVKVGTDGKSAVAAEQLGARAFTTDGEVHFGAGEFAPGTKEGDRLMAHELTHVVQGQRSGVQRKAEHEHDGAAGEHDVSQPGDPAEQEADSVADHVTDKLHGQGNEAQAGAAHGADASAAAPAASQPVRPISAKHYGLGTKIYRKAPGAAPPGSSHAPAGSAAPKSAPSAAASDIKSACAKKGGAAATIIGQLEHEPQVDDGTKQALFTAATELLKKTPDDPLGALQSALKANPTKFLCRGHDITVEAVKAEGGINRLLDLPSVHKYYLNGEALNRFKTKEQFLSGATKHAFDPYKDMNEDKNLEGWAPLTWWSAGPPLPGDVSMGKLMKQIHVDNAGYEEGAVRLEVSPDEFAKSYKDQGLRIYKPTAFDGAFQVSNDGKALFNQDKDGSHVWGLTHGGAKEAAMKPTPIRVFKSRRLIVPTGDVVPAAASAAAAGSSKAPPPHAAGGKKA